MNEHSPNLGNTLDMAAKAVNLSEELLKKNVILMNGFKKISNIILIEYRAPTKQEITDIIIETMEKVYPNEQDTHNTGLVQP